MMTHLSHTLLNAVLRLTGATQDTRTVLRAAPPSIPPPDHVVRRLEDVFEALAELSHQPHVAGALELACDTLQAELPTEAGAAALYDIDSDELCFVVARGVEHDLLRGTSMPRARCLVGRAAEHAIITGGGASGVDWLGEGSEDSTILLCPILHDANLLGVIALADPLCAAQFSHHDQELVSYVAAQLATFIQAQRGRPLRPSTR